MSWSACVQISNTGSHSHVIVQTESDVLDDALRGCQSIMDKLTDGKNHFVRSIPLAKEDRNFETGVTTMRGYCRFTVLDDDDGRKYGDSH